jgi:hypothetical protein
MAGALDCNCKRPLVLGACADPASRLDLATVGDEAPQQGYVLVINMDDAIGRQRVHSPAGERSSPTTAAATAAKPAWWTAPALARATSSFFSHCCNSLPVWVVR